MKIRLRESGNVIDESEFRARRTDTSFPEQLTADILNLFDADEVVQPALPTTGENQFVAFVEVAQIDGVWQDVYEVRDLSPQQIAERLQQERMTMIVSPYQGKAALYAAGLLDDVEALIASEQTDRLIKLAWDNAGEWRRLSPMIVSLAASLNLTEDQVDQLFKDARLVSA